MPEYSRICLAYDAAIFGRSDKRSLAIYTKSLLDGNKYDKVYEGCLHHNANTDCKIVVIENGCIVLQDDVTSVCRTNMELLHMYSDHYGTLVGNFHPDRLVYRNESSLDIYSVYGNHQKVLSLELKTRSLKSTLLVVEHPVSKWMVVWEAQCKTLYFYDSKGKL